jgi:hypothetical protein
MFTGCKGREREFNRTQAAFPASEALPAHGDRRARRAGSASRLASRVPCSATLGRPKARTCCGLFPLNVPCCAPMSALDRYVPATARHHPNQENCEALEPSIPTTTKPGQKIRSFLRALIACGWTALGEKSDLAAGMSRGSALAPSFDF